MCPHDSTTKPTIPLEWVPTMLRRYAATVIDGLLVLAVAVVPSAVWPTDNLAVRTLRFTLAVVVLFVYEPLGTGRFETLGQMVSGVRVRRFDNGRRIGILRAYARLFLKVVFGIVSFLILPFTNGRRALHDLSTGSIVIMASSEAEFAAWATSRLAVPALLDEAGNPAV